MEVPFSVAGESIKVGASIGISVYPQDSKEPEKIIHFADTAMYEAKNHYHPYCFYHDMV
jgi:predicted signal transduction protein with EAL and GGDEF domain